MNSLIVAVIYAAVISHTAVLLVRFLTELCSTGLLLDTYL